MNLDSHATDFVGMKLRRGEAGSPRSIFLFLLEVIRNVFSFHEQRPLISSRLCFNDVLARRKAPSTHAYKSARSGITSRFKEIFPALIFTSSLVLIVIPMR